jgi:hypothetical protein
VRAHRRDLQLTRIHEHPFWAVVAGFGTYNPDSSPSGTSPQLTLGLRYVKPQKTEDMTEFTAFEVAASTLFSDSEDLEHFSLTFLNFVPRTRLFEFDHHFFYGAGFGTAVVSRPAAPTLTLPLGILTAGLQTRIKHFDVEGSVKLHIGPRRSVFDATGTVAEMKFIYPFDY